MTVRARRLPVRQFDPMTLFAPHVVLPAQGTEALVPLDPDRRLMFEVLSCAIDDLRTVWRGHGGRKGPERYRAARAWLFSDNRGWCYAAANLCDHLNIDLRVVRHAILRMEARQERGAA